MNEPVQEYVRRIREASEQAIDAAGASRAAAHFPSIAHGAAISAAFPFTTPPSGRGKM
jgi:hypothetical protein